MANDKDMKLCFVVQGFGEKTDLATGRVLNLDASYRIIKLAVQDAGLSCLRADEAQRSGNIDIPMYENLLRADLVIADLSTSNVNAFFELGVRYGLRPRATIVICESGLRRPFDVNHIKFFTYEHLGKDVGSAEADRIRQELKQLILAVIASDHHDSPVYTTLQKLSPPSEISVFQSFAQKVGLASPVTPLGPVEGSAALLMAQALSAAEGGEFQKAQPLLEIVAKIRPSDDFVRQQLALATYKSKSPDPLTALKKAQEILRELRPEVSNDPETLGLWGAVHKRLWEETGARDALDFSVDGYERGYYLKNDYYNGINLAFVLNVRAAESLKSGQLADSIADFVVARRVRVAVLAICSRMVQENQVSEKERYWVPATAWEAAAGLGDAAEAEKWRKRAEDEATKAWMKSTTEEQIAKVGALLANSPLEHLKV